MSSLISNRHNELIPVYMGYLNANINSTFSLHTQGNMRKLCEQQAKPVEVIVEIQVKHTQAVCKLADLN